jgi:hypothetical protein
VARPLLADFVDLVGQWRGWRCPLSAEAAMLVFIPEHEPCGSGPLGTYLVVLGSLPHAGWSVGGESGLSLASFPQILGDCRKQELILSPTRATQS